MSRQPEAPARSPDASRPRGRLASWRRRAGWFAVFVAAALAAGRAPPAVADATRPYTVEIADVTARVGEPAVLHATVTLRDGYRVLRAYDNRVMELSCWDDGVAFEHKVVKADVHDGALAFAVDVTATKPGKHPINGVFRFGYIDGDTMMMVSVPLIATVTGTK